MTKYRYKYIIKNRAKRKSSFCPAKKRCPNNASQHKSFLKIKTMSNIDYIVGEGLIPFYADKDMQYFQYIQAII